MNNKLINHKIEIVRLIALFSVIYLHFLGNGNIIRNLEYMSFNYIISWVIECASFFAISYFALISGYLTYKKKFLISSLLYNWLTTIFYSVSIAAIILFINHNLSWNTIKDFFFPFINKYNWYFVCYVILSLIQPLIYLYHKYTNKIVDSIVLIIFFILLSLMPMLGYDILNVNLGYSTIWLLYLYLIGAYIHKHNCLPKLKSWLLGFIAIFCLAGMFASKIYIGYKTYPLDNNYVFNQLINYTSPTVLFASISIFILVLRSKIQLSAKAVKVLTYFSGSAFALYIIQVHPLFWACYANIFTFLGHSNIITFLAYLIFVPLLFTLLMATIDNLKKYLFHLLRIDTTCKYIGNLFNR